MTKLSENFSLADIDAEERGLIELKRDSSVTKQLLLKLNGKSKRLVVG